MTKRSWFERYLPNKGTLFVQKGDVLEPFQKLGDCMHSPNVIYFPRDFETGQVRERKSIFPKGKCYRQIIWEKSVGRGPWLYEF
ncbi:MAG: hypothetical protein KatS3mg101_0480 [Patescibacteria group bacterium]|nr:MAG: hypothetical protein KatS3mg101_0480 [Patescibacteria group bacterium]